ncbi:hypothetical protein ACFQU7_06450 [Pseudoroseomonas wenyumeiae]
MLGVAIRFMPFVNAQWVATFVAMTANFWLNNRITYRDVRLRGPKLWRGLISSTSSAGLVRRPMWASPICCCGMNWRHGGGPARPVPC